MQHCGDIFPILGNSCGLVKQSAYVKTTWIKDMKGTNQFTKNYLILTKSNIRKKLAKKKLGHPATAWIQAGTRCPIPEKLSHFNRVQTQKKNGPKKN